MRESKRKSKEEACSSRRTVSIEKEIMRAYSRLFIWTVEISYSINSF
jgi:hypothetical protein